MRLLAKQIIAAAAVKAGLDASRVIDKPKRPSPDVLATFPRLEFETMGESLSRGGGMFAIIPGTNPVTHIKKRRKIYTRTLKVRAAVFAADEAWLEAFVVKLLSAMPHKIGDADNNLVLVEASRAERGGFETRTVEVSKSREAAIRIDFTGAVCTDQESPLIKSVSFVNGVTIK